MRTPYTQTPSLHKSCLIIESSDHIRRFVSVNLIVRGFDVQQAITLEQGFGILDHWQPSFIILEMPFTESVRDWLLSLRAVPALRHLPLILFTTEKYQLKKLQAVAPNAAAVLEKPITAGVLLSTISRVLHNYAEISGTESEA